VLGQRTILLRQICCGNPHFAERDERVNDDTSLGALNSGSVVEGLVARPKFVNGLVRCWQGGDKCEYGKLG
jgi:hypothetical protein